MVNKTVSSEISTYIKTDKASIIELIVNIQRNEYGLDIDGNDQPDLKNISSFYQVDKGNFWVAKFDGQIVGTIALWDDQAALRKMFVKKEFRGKVYSISGGLLATLLDWAKVRGIKSIYLGTVDKFHAAHRFYEKNGFKQCNKNSLPQSFPLVKVDNLFYYYTINTAP